MNCYFYFKHFRFFAQILFLKFFQKKFDLKIFILMKFYLTKILVLGASPLKISFKLYLLLAINTSVPFCTGALMYSNFALAQFAPFLLAPKQNCSCLLMF